jgi:hypothetical protein
MQFITELIEEFPLHFVACCLLAPTFVVSGIMVVVETARLNRKRRKAKGNA